MRSNTAPWLRSAGALLIAGVLLVPTSGAVAGEKERGSSAKDPMRVSDLYNDSAQIRARARKTVLPGLQVPFPCGQSWVGSTRSSHSPSSYSVDFNRTNDEGSPVVASASGTVTTAQASPEGGYGRWIVIDHGGSVSTLYAHLKRVLVVPGQYVEQGSLVGVVGTSGNSTGPHLHHEQKLGRTVVAPAFSGTRFKWGSIASSNCLDVPLAGDFDGNGVDDLAVYRRNATGSFSILGPDGERSVAFGSSVETPFVADVDGDGVDDLGVRNPRTKVFRMLAGNATTRATFGLRLDRPVSGDWDGSGVDRLGVHRPGTATFRLRGADGKVQKVQLGTPGDLPVTGDFDGDGIDDVGVYDTAGATFTLRTVDAAGAVVLRTAVVGVPGDLPVVGDWNGDGIDDLGTWAPATATFTQLVPRRPGAARTRVVTTAFGRPR